MSQTQVLRVSAGAADYTWPGIITDESGRPLNPSQVKVALIGGRRENRRTWQAGVVTAVTASQVSAQLWIDSTTVRRAPITSGTRSQTRRLSTRCAAPGSSSRERVRCDSWGVSYGPS
jgi:hypothetical protein